MSNRRTVVSLSKIYNTLEASGILNNLFMTTLISDMESVDVSHTNARLHARKYIYLLMEIFLGDILNSPLLSYLGKTRNALDNFQDRQLATLDIEGFYLLFNGETVLEYISDKDYYNGYRQYIDKGTKRLVTEGSRDMYESFQDILDEITGSDLFLQLVEPIHEGSIPQTLWSVERLGVYGTYVIINNGDYRALVFEKEYMKDGKYVGDILL